MNSWDGMNRRKFPRVNYPCQVVIREGEGREALLTHTENVGMGGVSLILKNNVKMFTSVEMEIDLLDMQSHIKCHGKVVWAIRRKTAEKKKPLFYDIGIEFVDISDADLKRLEAVIMKLAKKNTVDESA